MERQSGKLWSIWLTTVIAMFLVALQSFAADVDVYGEGTYSDDRAAVRILADINTGESVSFGVKLSYDPRALKVADATINERVWYLGNASTKYAYAGADLSTDGEVLLLGARLDTDTPRRGASGTRVLLAEVVFESMTPFVPALSLSAARSGDYKNFVMTDGTVLDDSPHGVEFGPVAVPEVAPARLGLVAIGLLGFLVTMRRRRGESTHRFEDRTALRELSRKSPS